MTTTYKIHPAIGIARVGNSPESFYIAPERTGAPPIDCDANGIPVVRDGVEQPVTHYKDAEHRIKRQAARFRIYVYDDQNPTGRELKLHDTVVVELQQSGQLFTADLTDIQWTVYLANKKSSWYEFQQLDGEHGYEAGHPLRNPEVTSPSHRQKLIIDVGPQTVSWQNPKERLANFSPGSSPGTPASFPPENLRPNPITTLGEIRSVTGPDGHNRLLVLGGLGNSGSSKSGATEPSIQHYANNDGWFDDISDGPVSATLICKPLTIDGYPAPAGMTPLTIPVDVPAWVMVGYPRYAPQITDIVTMDDLVYDIAVRYFNYAPMIYGHPPFDPHVAVTDVRAWREKARWNPDYYPYFWRDIWPILTRPFAYQFVTDFDAMTGGDPHQTGKGSGGNMDPDQISIPPHAGENPTDCQTRRARRQFVYSVLRKPGQENHLYTGDATQFARLFAMPFLCGDNPLTNTVASKFLRLTETMLFILHQWAEGKFVNEKLEDIVPPQPPEPVALDQGVLGNGLGGAFCPGGEAAWIMRNPAIYSGAYRIKASPSPLPGSLSLPPAISGADTTASLQSGQEPGDLTKYSAVPWQADFNECTTQPIDITYANWSVIDPNSTLGIIPDRTQLTYWWPAHRPVVVNNVPWSPTPDTNAGDITMVSIWSLLGFVIPAPGSTPENPNFEVVEDQIST